MKSNRKIEKVLETDGDLFIREKKQDILSQEFLNLPKSSLTHKPKRNSMFVKHAYAVAMVVILLICSVFTVSLFLEEGDSPAIDIPQASSGEVQMPPLQNDPVFEPELWEGAADTPYAIVKIGEISKDTIKLSQDGVLQNYVKVKGEVISSYNTERFDINNSLFNGADVTDFKVVAFNHIREFYVTEQSVELIEDLDTIFINVVKMNMDGKFYYGPVTNDQGISEYLPIVNGKLQINEEDYNTRSFLPIQILNETLDELRDYLNRGGKETEFTKALPSKKITDATSTEDVDLYFEAWYIAKTLNESEKFRQELSELGLCGGDIVMVHSSMKALKTKRTPEEVIDDIQAVLGEEGTR